ncbi:MAG: hypothetical protein L6R38_003089 [Xanthoria sp. 2 TBL-2021]|nr:MAG: hypothetical protein L6R38_003089 [Xanthoria sp. 2 TBL-2021]
MICKEFRDLADPEPEEYLAILFPFDQPAPKLVWFGLKGKPENRVPDLWRLLRSTTLKRALACIHCTYNALRGLFLTYTLKIWRLPQHEAAQAEVNESIQAITHQTPAQEWRGSIVVTASEAGNPTVYRDIGMKDIRNAVDFFAVSRGSVLKPDLPDYHLMRYKTRGVRVNCDGDIKLFSKKYIEVDVPKDHPAFSTKAAPISDLVRMPVHTWVYPPHPLWENHEQGSPYRNESAMFLREILDSVKIDGFVPPPLNPNVGSILVVRRDKKDITAKEVAALCDYCQFKLNPKPEENLCYVRPQHFQDYMAQEHVFDELNLTTGAEKLDPATGPMVGEQNAGKGTVGEKVIDSDLIGEETIGDIAEETNEEETDREESEREDSDGQEMAGKELVCKLQ